MGRAIMTWKGPGSARLANFAGVGVMSRMWPPGFSNVLCEAYGLGIPIAALPCLNAAQAAHPAYRQSLERRRGMGVLVVECEPHQPKAGGGRDTFRWQPALELLSPKVR